MKRIIEFKNFNQIDTNLSANLYIKGKFLFNVTGKIEDICNANNTDATILNDAVLDTRKIIH